MGQVTIPLQILRQAEKDGIPPALLERAAEAECPEELAVLAREMGGTLSVQDARSMFTTLQTAKAAQGAPGELTDDELAGVSGGAGGWEEFLSWLVKLMEMIVKAFGG